MNAEASSFEAPTLVQQKSTKMARVAESVGMGLTVLALLAGITTVVTAGDALAVYNTTSLPGEYLLPLWPADFNSRPSVALVVCGTIIILASAASLVHSKVSAVSSSPLPEVRKTNCSQDAQCPIHPPLGLVRWSNYLSYLWPGRNILLLRRQCLEHHIHTTQLVVPMVTRYHGCETTLGCSLQRDLGSDILDGHDDTVGVAGSWFSRIQQIRRVQADVREGEEDKQPCHVLKDVEPMK
jgi:hypothetical protein